MAFMYRSSSSIINLVLRCAAEDLLDGGSFSVILGTPPFISPAPPIIGLGDSSRLPLTCALEGDELGIS